MRNTAAASMTLEDARDAAAAYLMRQLRRTGGLALVLVGGFMLAAMASWNIADPSLSHATGNPVTNLMGPAGAVTADILIQAFGIAATLALVPLFSFGWTLMRGHMPRIGRARIGLWAGFAVAAAATMAALPVSATWPLPTGLGGVVGDLALKPLALVLGGYPEGLAGIALAVPLAAIALYALSATLRSPKAALTDIPPADMTGADEDDADGPLAAAIGFLQHHRLALMARFGRKPSARRRQKTEPGDDRLLRARKARETARRAAEAEEAAFLADEPLDDMLDDVGLDDAPQVRTAVGPAARRTIDPAPAFDDDDVPFDLDDEDDEDDFGMAQRAPVAQPRSTAAPQQTKPVRVDAPAKPAEGARLRREAQATFLKEDRFALPSIHLLAENRNVVKDAKLTKGALEENARMLEGVLEDFGVRGEIIHIRPGPVVTLYELEPAPGIKSARVIGLADDIARSMSAIAARVAVVPGRNAIGIELPNETRETVYLRELIASKDFEGSKAKLALSLGKTINGEAVIADLAKMPHLLVAGTTGSGKSVGINAMILSILYRMTPDQCRLIMIDPKMLELSVYDGIPHLLTPVVTDPKKAVVALKWTVREMEDRYRKMAKLGVRNIDGFNQRVAEAGQDGKGLSRTVQTGYDRDTGEAIYETERLEMEKMPYIVVIIDEMADLMMVAGKDIEGAVQRLAQMARAAGIHVIMATQRPSVDVITGTIKANFPTRISFQVTSKIDSRTILGEQGAEQLLGMGDMLYQATGGRTQRVHGPFVSDQEVEAIVSHLKTQGVPDYLDAVTEDEEDEDDGPSGGSSASGGAASFDDSDDPYDQAVAVVLRDRKVSTSYIQRRLGIGYNRAASIIERMEQEGLIGAANHAGKREILVPDPEETM